MEKYKNLGGDSGVAGYELGTDFIIVEFNGGKRLYKWSYSKAGKVRVDIMKELAVRGRGLNTYINKFVKKMYD